LTDLQGNFPLTEMAQSRIEVRDGETQTEQPFDLAAQ
jgi:hypothetical protein